MGFGPVARAVASASDVVAPGLCKITGITQAGKNEFAVSVELPTLDADDTELSGLTGLTIAIVDIVDGNDPSLGLGMTDILALPGVKFVDVALTPADAGTFKTVQVPIVDLHGDQSITAACKDD